MIAQLCGNDPEALVQSAVLLEGKCAAVDINLGCPQKIAKKGKYGAFLAENVEQVRDIVTRLVNGTKLPVCCKMRIYDDTERTIQFARMLEDCGCKLLTVHGRTKEQINLKNTAANWEEIAKVVKAVKIPVIANGSIKTFADAQRCMEVTGAAGCMSGTGLIENPALFSGVDVHPCDIALEFINICREYPVAMQQTRGILVKQLLPLVSKYGDIREELVTAVSVEELETIVKTLRLKTLGGEPESDSFCTCEMPWNCDESLVKLSLVKGEFWREGVAYARAPHERAPLGKTGGWIALIGMGKRVMNIDTLRTLRDDVEARAWQCRGSAIYLDIPDNELYQKVKETKKIQYYYTVVDNANVPPPEKKAKI